MKSPNYNRIIKTLKTKGFKNIKLDSVLESKFILQRSGENFRKYLFSFYNSNGEELCLRPDLTISSVLRYAQGNRFNKEKVFYTGSAFRKSYNKKNILIKQGKYNPENFILNQKISYFPDGYRKNKGDVVSERALKHINELSEVTISKIIRPIICFVIQRTDSSSFQASNIDPTYKEAFNQAIKKGVEVIVLVVEWNEIGEAKFIRCDLPVNL